MQAIERKLNQNLAKNPKLVKFLKTFSIPAPYIRKYANLRSDYNDQLSDLKLSLV